MNLSTDPKNNDKTEDKEKVNSAEETRQQQSDPNITELKGLVDPDEDLEVKGTDNKF